GGVLGSFAGTDKGTLASWQGATSQDAVSISVKPIFIAANTGDLHLQTDVNCAFDGTGATGTGVTIDYDNQSRNAPPDMGADEFTSIFAAASAGANQNICGASTTLAGNAPASGVTGAWSILSGSGGSVTTPSSPVS